MTGTDATLKSNYAAYVCNNDRYVAMLFAHQLNPYSLMAAFPANSTVNDSCVVELVNPS